MKNIFIGFLLLSFTTMHAQEKLELGNQDGIYVTCEFTKISDNGKKDKYVCSVRAENRNNYDVYYTVALIKDANGAEVVNSAEGFSQVSVRNSTGLFGSGIFGAQQTLKGQETKFKTTDNKMLFMIGRGQFISSEFDFHVLKGEKPIITNTFSKSLQKSGFFEVVLNEAMVNGNWVANCGTVQMNLVMTTNERKETIIQQEVNGRRNTWIKINDYSFEKMNDRSVTITFNRSDNTFLYSNTDGVICSWMKK
ncbi:MAG: hypothetical protein ACHQK8_06005 [Bacteroidia bacterium]